MFGVAPLVVRSRLFALSLLLTPLAACATVEVYKPATTAETTAIQTSGELRKASQAYCDNARAKGWAWGEASLGAIAGMLTGKGGGDNAYWKKIEADKQPVASVLTRVRADASEAARGLGGLGGVAGKAIKSKTKPTRNDVTEYERALIHARQARDSFAGALDQLNLRAADAYNIGQELDVLDRAITTAARTADDLAAARIAETKTVKAAS